MVITLDDLRRFSVARNFPKPAALNTALQRIGFVQADPIRAPARAQDLILRHRVRNYHAGDLERLYTKLDIEEDVFINYGYVTRSLQALMHPRSNFRVPPTTIVLHGPLGKRRRPNCCLISCTHAARCTHVKLTSTSHMEPSRTTGADRQTQPHTSSTTCTMLVSYGWRVVRKASGFIKHINTNLLRASAAERRARVDALVDVVVRIYAPLPAPSLSSYLRRLRYAAPQWRKELPSALERAKQRLSHARCKGIEWYWPSDETVLGHVAEETVRLLAPFDPLVHDRARFERLWNWTYRFEAYTPVPKRKLGYYAMPLLWREHVIGWANLSNKNGRLEAVLGYVEAQPPRDRAFKRELEAELELMRHFLRL